MFSNYEYCICIYLCVLIVQGFSARTPVPFLSDPKPQIPLVFEVKSIGLTFAVTLANDISSNETIVLVISCSPTVTCRLGFGLVG